MSAGIYISCLLGRHRPWLDYSACTRPEPNVIIGPVRRYCIHCGKTLPGNTPQVGDRGAPPTYLPESLS